MDDYQSAEQWCRNILGISTDPDHAVDRFTSYALTMLAQVARGGVESYALGEAQEALLQIRARKFNDRERFAR